MAILVASEARDVRVPRASIYLMKARCRQPVVSMTHATTIKGSRVGEVLKQAESRFPFVGTSLLDVFFPGSLRVKELADIEFWRKALDSRTGPNAHGARVGSLPPKLTEKHDNDIGSE